MYCKLLSSALENNPSKVLIVAKCIVNLEEGDNIEDTE